MASTPILSHDWLNDFYNGTILTTAMMQTAFPADSFTAAFLASKINTGAFTNANLLDWFVADSVDNAFLLQAVVDGGFAATDATRNLFAAAFIGATAVGRALVADDFFDAATVLTKFDAGAIDNANFDLIFAVDSIDAASLVQAVAPDSFTNAVLLDLVQDGAFVADAGTRALFGAGFVTAAMLAADVETWTTVVAPADAAALAPTVNTQYDITTAAAETNTLAIPSFLGQVVAFTTAVYAVGDRVITVASAINQAGNTIMTFGAVGDTIVLRGVSQGGTLRWIVEMNDGVALS